MSSDIVEVIAYCKVLDAIDDEISFPVSIHEDRVDRLNDALDDLDAYFEFEAHYGEEVTGYVYIEV